MGLPTTYDTLFAKYGPHIPAAYKRAIVKSESDFNPKSVTASSHATGLFQVVKIVLDDYNKLHKTKYTLEDMKDPELNSKVGLELLERIATNYSKHPSLKPDWNDPRFVALFTAGFNAGYSDVAGVGYVADHLEKLGIPSERITVDNITQAAEALPKASRFLRESDRLKYWKLVARRYFQEIGKPLPVGWENTGLSQASSSVGRWLVFFGLGGLIAWGIKRNGKRS